jgi:hypothetical protein
LQIVQLLDEFQAVIGNPVAEAQIQPDQAGENFQVRRAFITQITGG